MQPRPSSVPEEPGRAEQALAELVALVESSHDAIMRLDETGRVIVWNRGAQRLYGYTSAEVAGRTVLELQLHEGDTITSFLGRVFAGEQIEGVDAEGRRKDGMGVPVTLTIAPVLEPDGSVGAALVVARETTEQKMTQAALAESAARLREAQALAHVGLWLWDAGSDTVQWSDELYLIHGVTPLDFDGTLESHLRFVDEEDRAGIAMEMHRVLAKAESLECEYSIVRPDGTRRWVAVRGEPAVDPTGHVAGLRGIYQDVTEQHQLEESLRVAFERERLAAEQLREADRLKDQFLAVVSHELRTPLASILGFAHVLLDTSADDPAIRAQMLERIAGNAAEMRRMVERLLDFSRLQAGKVDLAVQTVDVVAAVDRCLDGLVDVLSDHRTAIEVAPDLAVVADPDGFTRILSNLLTNATKFSPPDSTISVIAVRDGAEAVITVTDEGPGIPDELREHVFERFFQTPDQPVGKRGTGVGLAIAQRYAELQGGRIWVESATGGGAAFRFTLPLAE